MQQLLLPVALVPEHPPYLFVQIAQVLELPIHLQLQQLLPIVVTIQKQRFQLWQMCQRGQFGHKSRDEQVAIGVIDVLAVAFEGGVDLLLAEVERIGPVDVAILHERDVGVVGVVLLLEEAVVEAGVDHEQDVVEVERMRDRVLVQQDLLLVLAQLF